MAREAAVLQAVDLGVDYRAGDRSVTALDGVSLVVPPGSFTVLAGPSGSGKSSLLRSLGLLDRPSRGALQVAGVDVLALSDRRRRRMRRERLAYVHQRPVANLVDDLTAMEQVVFARACRGMPPGDPEAVLARFGLAHRAAAPPAALSGGEQQRLAVAMAAAASPAVLFADEPTAELDRRLADEVVAALVAAADGGGAVVAASHDPALIGAATHVVRLHEGRRVDE